MSLAQFSAYHLREIIYHLDMIAIARTTKLTATSKEKAEDETMEPVNAPGSLVETEFHGGEQADEPEDDEVGPETWRPMFSLSLDQVNGILSRRSEVAAASKKGRKSAVVLQMKSFDDCYHAVMNTTLPACTAEPEGTQHLYAHAHSAADALLHQDAILKLGGGQFILFIFLGYTFPPPLYPNTPSTPPNTPG